MQVDFLDPLNRLPPSLGLPSLVRNGLYQSKLVNPNDLPPFKLDQNVYWQPALDSATNRLVWFLCIMMRALELFFKKMVILPVNKGLVLTRYIEH